MVNPVSFLCLFALAIMSATAQAQDQDDGNGAALIESGLAYEDPPDDGPEQVTTTIIVRIDRGSAFPESQLPATQLPQSQLMTSPLSQSTVFSVER